jgi:hypothetical protein
MHKKEKKHIWGTDHWEMKYDPTPKGESKKQSIQNWDPMKSKDRPCTHEKINESDH